MLLPFNEVPKLIELAVASQDEVSAQDRPDRIQTQFATLGLQRMDLRSQSGAIWCSGGG